MQERRSRTPKRQSHGLLLLLRLRQLQRRRRYRYPPQGQQAQALNADLRQRRHGSGYPHGSLHQRQQTEVGGPAWRTVGDPQRAKSRARLVVPRELGDRWWCIAGARDHEARAGRERRDVVIRDEELEPRAHEGQAAPVHCAPTAACAREACTLRGTFTAHTHPTPCQHGDLTARSQDQGKVCVPSATHEACCKTAAASLHDT